MNRTTISAAYDLLESEGLIAGHVGRGSFVAWPGAQTAEDIISFAASRPSELLFPLAEFRESCREVINGSGGTSILQLGPSTGYGPLRRYLLNEAKVKGTASLTDDVAVTSGCQQALDLIAASSSGRATPSPSRIPVYPGLQELSSARRARS